VNQTKRRWRLRFGIRTLLVTVTILAIGLGYVAMLLQRVRHERRIVAQVEAAGGKVQYNYQFGMGRDLDYALHPDEEPRWIMESNPEGEPNSRYRTDDSGRVIERQYETPPGPAIIRWLLGDDIFAYVESVNFFDFDAKPATGLKPDLLLELPELKCVVLTDHQVSDEWLACVAKVPKLRFLNLLASADCKATADGITQLRSARHLELLGITGDGIKDETVAGIAELRELKSLTLASVPNISSAVLPNLNELTELRELSIVRAKSIDDQNAHHLRRLQKLERLWLVGTSMTDATLVHLGSLPQLEILDVYGTNVGDAGMEHLAKLPRLERLRIAGGTISDAGIEHIARFPALRRLSLFDTKITDAGLPIVGRMKQLEELRLGSPSITDCGVMQLGTLTNLRDLSLDARISDQCRENLRKILPECDIPWASW